MLCMSVALGKEKKKRRTVGKMKVGNTSQDCFEQVLCKEN